MLTYSLSALAAYFGVCLLNLVNMGVSSTDMLTHMKIWGNLLSLFLPNV
jgi:hypothetical protein